MSESSSTTPKTFDVTEAEADLVHRGLKFAEADIIKFRASAEQRGFKHTIDECNVQLQLLRGDGVNIGLLAKYAPQLDAFEAGKLDGAGEASEDGQLSLADQIIPGIGAHLVFPDASYGIITEVVSGGEDGSSVVYYRAPDEAESVRGSRGEVLYRNGEWRDADWEREGQYAVRDEQLIVEAQRKLASDVATDDDVSINGEGHATPLKTRPAKRPRTSKPAPGEKKKPGRPKGSKTKR